MRRTLFMSPTAIRDLYTIPRGIVGELTSALRVLETNPTPDQSTPVAERAGRYEFRALDYVAGYTVEEERIIVLYVNSDE
jgi:mRNA-degrading endonuclease RelE of RelBE toxin-antitoxin system